MTPNTIQPEPRDPEHNAMDSKDLAIGVLSTTAVILFVGLILLNSQPNPARASGMGDRGGDYLMVSGAMWNQEELVYIVDTAADKMMVYRFDRNTNQILGKGPADLSQWLGDQTSKKKKRGRRGGRRSRP